MMLWYIQGVLVYILVLLSHKCSCQNFTDLSYNSTTDQPTPYTFNSSITENLENVTVVTQMTSQDGTTDSSLSHMTVLTESPLEPSPSWDMMHTSDIQSLDMQYFLETVTITSEEFYFSSLISATAELRPTQSLDMTTSFMTEHSESSEMASTDGVQLSTVDVASSYSVAIMETSSLQLLPATTTLSDIPVMSPSLVITPSSSLTVVSTAGLTLATTEPPQRTTPPRRTTIRPADPTEAYEDFKFTMKMDGNCDDVKSDEYSFKLACVNAITERTGVESNQLVIDHIRCGSIVLDFTFYDRTGEDKGTEMLEMASKEEPLIIRFNGVEYTVVEVEDASVTTTKSSDDGDLSIEDQRLLIYCIAGGLCSFVVILAICVCISQSCKNRVKKRGEDIRFQSSEHLTKLSDMNLTTTIIPRPKSIYGNVGDYKTRCSLFAITNNYYYYNNGAFMFDDETQQNGETTDGDGEGGVMIAVEVNEPTTPGAKASEQFGMSGIPDWNLPQLEGVVRAGKLEEASDTASIHDFSRPSSRTFSVPLPPPPPPLPINQEVTDITFPVPQWNRQSDAYSEITDSSSGDTNVLLRGGSQRKKMQGLENEGLQLDEDNIVITDGQKDNTLTRKPPGSHLAPHEALSRL